MLNSNSSSPALASSGVVSIEVTAGGSRVRLSLPQLCAIPLGRNSELCHKQRRFFLFRCPAEVSQSVHLPRAEVAGALTYSPSVG